MAAYAALNSVMFILQQIQHHPRPPITLEKHHMDSLCEIISFLQDFLENCSLRDIGDGKEALESQIADAAYAAEDVVESHIVDQILAKSNFHEQNNLITLFYRGVKKMITTLACSNSVFCQDLQKVIEAMNLIRKEAIKIQEKMKGIDDDQLPRNNISKSANIIGSSTVPPPKRKHYTNTMVGFDDVLFEIMDRLTGHPPDRQVLPIVGMGGIGKTTLARNVYDNPTIAEHFHIRIWVTLSQDYRLRDILLDALSFVDKSYKSEDELGDHLYKSLCGRRYLIVLDDVWSIEAWEKLMLFFPDNNNGSRITITTRLSNVSDHFRSHSFKLNFLDEGKSWDLFCKVVFPQDQCCPLELEEIGKRIATNCQGLPLSIVVIGGLLANSEKTQQLWEYIAENLNPIVNLEDEMRCFKILYLSYDNLPIHLKPCFLYMGVFSEDSIISVSRLKKLWVAEGFLKPIAAKSLEEVAEEYLKDLIDRNLILVHKLGCSGKVKCCKIHDLLRDLCIREGQKDKFLWVRRENDSDNFDGIQSQRRISFHKSAPKKYHVDRVIEVVPSASLARSLTYGFTCDVNDVLSSHSNRLMRVFNMGSAYPVLVHRYGDLKHIFILVNARYFEFGIQRSSTDRFLSCRNLPWNLQTFIFKDFTPYIVRDVPPEIWKMSQLRHLELESFSLQNPPIASLIDEGDFILRNLHTMKRAFNLKLSEELIKRIPNIKKLHLGYHGKSSGHNYCLNNFGLLKKLESLDIQIRGCKIEFLQNIAFPRSLKKLSLFGTYLLWEDMRMIGMLPQLQVLKLIRISPRGPEWNPVEEEFLCLKSLVIEDCDGLKYWNVNRTHFPSLEQLYLRDLLYLKEIPLDIGYIPTLRSIEMWRCCDSATMSAKKLLDEQVAFGNDDLKLIVNDKPQFSS